MLLLESEMPVSQAADIVGVYPQRLWNVFSHWVTKAIADDTPEPLTILAIDETSSKRGHSYATVGVDVARRKVVKVVEGKGAECISQIQKHLSDKNANAVEQIW